jgi:hypothetical protein
VAVGCLDATAPAASKALLSFYDRLKSVREEGPTG